MFGVVGIGFWILPTYLHGALGIEGEEGWWNWLGVQERSDGFDPGEVFGEGSAAYWFSLVMRFVRAAVVVALVEEIFWRSFAMRLALDWDGDYWKQAFGKGSWLSYGVVTGLFVVAHAPVDYAGALIYRTMTYLLCVWSRNLGACVVMHSVANLLMGLYAVAPERWVCGEGGRFCDAGAGHGRSDGLVSPLPTDFVDPMGLLELGGPIILLQLGLAFWGGVCGGTDVLFHRARINVGDLLVGLSKHAQRRYAETLHERRRRRAGCPGGSRGVAEASHAAF